MDWIKFERAIKLMTLIMEEAESGSPNLKDGQSQAWAMLHWVARRYNVPANIRLDVAHGFLCWIT